MVCGFVRNFIILNFRNETTDFYLNYKRYEFQRKTLFIIPA